MVTFWILWNTDTGTCQNQYTKHWGSSELWTIQREEKKTEGKLTVLLEQLSQNLCAKEGSSKKWSEFTLSPFVPIKDDDTLRDCIGIVRVRLGHEHFCCVVSLSLCSYAHFSFFLFLFLFTNYCVHELFLLGVIKLIPKVIFWFQRLVNVWK